MLEEPAGAGSHVEANRCRPIRCRWISGLQMAQNQLHRKHFPSL